VQRKVPAVAGLPRGSPATATSLAPRAYARGPILPAPLSSSRSPDPGRSLRSRRTRVRLRAASRGPRTPAGTSQEIYAYSQRDRTGVRAAARRHDLTAARTYGIPREPTRSGLITPGDKGCQRPAAGHPYQGKNKPASQKNANRAHAQLRSPGERASAPLKTWHIPHKLNCYPQQAEQLTKAIHVLPAREITR
jgi:hypothetical protein